MVDPRGSPDVLSVLSDGSAEDRRERLRRVVAGSPPVPVEDLSPGAGAVSGTVEVHEGTVDGPLTDRECVLVEYERERNDEGAPEVVEGRVESVPFLLADDTGRVLVDPSGHAYEEGVLPISPGRTERFEGDEAGENVRPVDDDPVLPWVHAEAAIRPDDEAYAVGTLTRVDDPDLPPDVRFRLAPGDATEEFVVTDLSRQALYEGLTPDSRVPAGFWRFALLGGILVAVVLGLVALFLAVFLV
ncbi:hypothetical protein BRD00_04735 [Halobacteriales archaeon QS_8_69_26]|nr:MAG: hypothetical protein BRD00_04735 [Halobacteriales archaeon QS_8_69_26]